MNENIAFTSMDKFFSPENIEEMKSCTPIEFKSIRFDANGIFYISEKQDIKDVLAFLFRTGNHSKASLNSMDNWYCYLEQNYMRMGCLFTDAERNNALLSTMRSIKTVTGYHVPYVFLRFELELDVESEFPSHYEGNNGTTVDFAIKPLMVNEKYMHYLGMKAGVHVSDFMDKLGFPPHDGLALMQALITDEPGERWSYYMFIRSDRFDLSDWCPPDQDLIQ